MILLFKILVALGAFRAIFLGRTMARLFWGERVNVRGVEIQPDINIEGVSEETATKIKKALGIIFIVFANLIAVFKLYVITWLI